MSINTPEIAETITGLNLVTPASAALAELVESTGDTKTDVINRAIQVYAAVMSVNADGGRIKFDDIVLTVHPK